MTDRPTIAKVHVLPSNITIEVPEGESLMRAAERVGYFWPTICHGQAICTACWIEVTELEAFEPPGPVEVNGLKLFEGRSFYTGKHIRLACQARPVVDTIVTKRGVRPSS